MKTFADLKRAIKPGVRLYAVEHWNPAMLNATRTVTKVQTNGYWFRIPNDEREMWVDYDKAACFTFPAPDIFRFEKNGRGWTLRIIPEEASANGSIDQQTA